MKELAACIALIFVIWYFGFHESESQKTERLAREAQAVHEAALQAHVKECAKKSGNQHFPPFFGGWNGVVETEYWELRRDARQLWETGLKTGGCVIFERRYPTYLRGNYTPYRGVTAFLDNDQKGEAVRFVLASTQPW